MNEIEEQIKQAEQKLEQESRRLARLKNIMKVANGKSAHTALSLAEQRLKVLYRRSRR